MVIAALLTMYLDLAGTGRSDRGHCDGQQARPAANPAPARCLTRRLIAKLIASSALFHGVSGRFGIFRLLARPMRRNNGFAKVRAFAAAAASYCEAKVLEFEPKSPIVRNEMLNPTVWVTSSVLLLRISP